MYFKKSSFPLLLVFFLGSHAFGQNVIEDQGVGMTAQEVEYIVKYWTPQMQESAAIDLGDRFELLNMAMANKKIALEAEKFTPEENAKRYWANQLILRNTKRKFVVDNYMANLKIPDMSELARERYATNPDKYALVPEARKVSHILFRCPPLDCARVERGEEAAAVLAQLEAGASFEELAAEFSEDPGSKDKGGKFDKWLHAGTEKVEPYFLQSALSLSEVGEISGLQDSRFGIHIIRLDEIREASYLPFEEVKQAIVDDLEYEYKVLAGKEFDARFRLTDEVYIDKAAMEKIFSEYQPDAAPVAE
jgi:peptidyl-prolyl cis-trans isomerase C